MWPHRRQPKRLPHPWDSPGKNTGVGCHFLFQCVKVKSESEVASRVRPSATPWTAAFQAPPSMGFSRQEYWSGVPRPSLIPVFNQFPVAAAASSTLLYECPSAHISSYLSSSYLPWPLASKVATARNQAGPCLCPPSFKELNTLINPLVFASFLYDFQPRVSESFSATSQSSYSNIDVSMLINF